jgi:hypothetical protein
MRALRAQWQRLQPAVAAMLRQVNAPEEPAFEDFAWAYSVFWSRGQSLPVPERAAAAEEEGERGGAAGGALRVVVREGVVPGLDFANHSAQVGPECRVFWSLRARVMQLPSWLCGHTRFASEGAACWIVQIAWPRRRQPLIAGQLLVGGC